VGLTDSGSDGDRLQHVRAVLPCEVRITSPTHPLFGKLLRAKGFKRLNGALLLVVDLPDGSPGTIRADATDVLGADIAPGPAVILDAEGLRALHQLVTRLDAGRKVRRGSKANK